jgi:hypothetical protein
VTVVQDLTHIVSAAPGELKPPPRDRPEFIRLPIQPDLDRRLSLRRR